MSKGLSLVPLSDPVGVRILDDIQGVTTDLWTNTAVSLSPCSPDAFCFPVDSAYDLNVEEVRLPTEVNVIIRARDATVLGTAMNKEETFIGSDQRGRRPLTAEVASQKVNLYFSARGGLQTTLRDGERHISTENGEPLRIGIRSRHEYPEATITTDSSPRSLMRAVSAFGSALKTDSPERSWPTMRGFPPLVEVRDGGQQFDDPANLEITAAESDVRIEVFPTHEAVFHVASLAYYLGVPVVPLPQSARTDISSPGRLIVGSSTVELGTGTHPHERVTEVLQQVFTLDCVTRTEGLYPIDLNVRNALEGRGICFDWHALYHDPLSERLQTYLSVPYSRLEDLVPRWKLTADIDSTPEHAEQLPFLVSELAEVRRAGNGAVTTAANTLDVVGEFYRERRLAAPIDGGPLRALPSRDVRNEASLNEQIITTAPTESIQHLWLSDGVPAGAAKPTIEAFKRRIDEQPSGDVRVAVVVNDAEMHDELSVQDLYGLRDFISFEVDIHENLTQRELAILLAEERDFVHYVGHVDERGIQCADGWLDARSLTTVNTRAFVLNACKSYDQGAALIEAGAIGGVVTLRLVPNEPATRIGRTLARLLNAGFSLGSALDLLVDDTITAQQYTVVGDPMVSVADGKSGTPISGSIERRGEDRFALTVSAYPSEWANLGATYLPSVSKDGVQYLNSGVLDTFELTGDELREGFSRERFPVIVNGRIHWSDCLSLDEIF
ncbi:hypothetical protein ACFPYI_00035 [Halomarina salina]|uniref:CHAT domain-containing protein n=1 Tax=Halomarina salina TaxID=1872699 RepID=A0ABD5RGQ5_9EURY|nr:hypothetical protein [Halomarina salina]